MPDDFVKVAKVSDIKEGRMKGVWMENKNVLLCNVDGKFHAIGNVCTHMGCLLGEGSLQGKEVVCPCHGSKFDVTNGKPTGPPATRAEPTYEVKIEGDQILIKKK